MIQFGEFRMLPRQSVGQDMCPLKATFLSCESRKRGTTSSEWKFQLHNLAVKGLSNHQYSVAYICTS